MYDNRRVHRLSEKNPSLVQWRQVVRPSHPLFSNIKYFTKDLYNYQAMSIQRDFRFILCESLSLWFTLTNHDLIEHKELAPIAENHQYFPDVWGWFSWATHKTSELTVRRWSRLDWSATSLSIIRGRLLDLITTNQWSYILLRRLWKHCRNMRLWDDIENRQFVLDSPGTLMYFHRPPTWCMIQDVFFADQGVGNTVLEEMRTRDRDLFKTWSNLRWYHPTCW